MCNMHLRLDLSCVTTSASLMYVTELIVVKCLTENNHKFRADSEHDCFLLFMGIIPRIGDPTMVKIPLIHTEGFLFDSWINYAPIYKKIQQYKTNYDSFFLQQGVLRTYCNVFKTPCRVLLVNLLLFIAEITLLRK